MFDNSLLFTQEDNVETAKDVSSIKSGIDQFKNDETDLLKTNAMSKFVCIVTVAIFYLTSYKMNRCVCIYIYVINPLKFLQGVLCGKLIPCATITALRCLGMLFMYKPWSVFFSVYFLYSHALFV